MPRYKITENKKLPEHKSDRKVAKGTKEKYCSHIIDLQNTKERMLMVAVQRLAHQPPAEPQGVTTTLTACAP